MFFYSNHQDRSKETANYYASRGIKAIYLKGGLTEWDHEQRFFFVLRFNCVELVLLSVLACKRNNQQFAILCMVVCCIIDEIHTFDRTIQRENKKSEKKKLAQVRQNRTAGQLLPYGFEVRTQHQLGSVLHHMPLEFIAFKGFVKCLVIFFQNKQHFCTLIGKIKTRIVAVGVAVGVEAFQTASHQIR